MKYLKIAKVFFLATLLFSNVCLVSGRQISVTEAKNIQNINVYRYVSGIPKLIYTGPAAEYENSIGYNFDFSTVQNTVIFDWESDEYIFIERTDAVVSYISAVNSVSEITAVYNEVSENSGTVSSNMNIVYNNKYYENVLIPNQLLTVPITVSNNTNSEKKYVPYIAQFDLDGTLIGIEVGETIIVPANSIADGTVSKFLDNESLSTAKIFLWEKDTQKPVSDTVKLTVYAQDYFSDSFDNASYVSIDKTICGVINAANDIDIVKFSPDISGVYAMRYITDSGLSAELYNSERELIKSTGINDNYILYNLEKDNDYYMCFKGNENKSYSLIPLSPGMIGSAVKNIGITSTVENDEFNIYSYIPDSDGTYIITAVGTDNAEANLYDENFSYITTGNVSDDDVSFRITQNLNSGKTYYIVVSSKSGIADYSLYIEEPLDLISVE